MFTRRYTWRYVWRIRWRCSCRQLRSALVAHGATLVTLDVTLHRVILHRTVVHHTRIAPHTSTLAGRTLRIAQCMPQRCIPRLSPNELSCVVNGASPAAWTAAGCRPSSCHEQYEVPGSVVAKDEGQTFCQGLGALYTLPTQYPSDGFVVLILVVYDLRSHIRHVYDCCTAAACCCSHYYI